MKNAAGCQNIESNADWFTFFLTHALSYIYVTCTYKWICLRLNAFGVFHNCVKEIFALNAAMVN